MTKEMVETDLAEQYRMLRAVRDKADNAHIERFVRWLEDKGRGLKPDVLVDYVAWLKNEATYERGGKQHRYSASGINTKLAAAKKAAREVARGLGAVGPSAEWLLAWETSKAKGMTINSNAVTRDRYLTPDEVRRLLTGTQNDRLGLMMRFLWRTGLRISEMLDVCWDDLGSIYGKTNKGQQRVLEVARGKGGKSRKLYVGCGLLDRIESTFSGVTWLFEHGGRQYSRVAVTNRIAAAARELLGRQGVGAHTLRHSFATNAIRKGWSLPKLSKWLGHSSVAITGDLYVHDEASATDVNLLWDDDDDDSNAHIVSAAEMRGLLADAQAHSRAQ